VQTTVEKLRSEAQDLFLKREFGAAINVYASAIKALPDGAPERLELWLKKIGCLLNAKRYAVRGAIVSARGLQVAEGAIAATLPSMVAGLPRSPAE
jgi:hypothetical protein